MLLKVLIGKLQNVFPNTIFSVNEDHRQITIPENYPGFGDVLIRDDGIEMTVYVGKFTHSHTSPQEDDLSDEDKTDTITDEVIDLLQNLFDDQLVLWRGDKGGGFYHKDAPLNLRRRLPKDGEKWVWSGPITE